jgi:hypothetical protein
MSPSPAGERCTSADLKMVTPSFLRSPQGAALKGHRGESERGRERRMTRGQNDQAYRALSASFAQPSFR